MFGATSSGGTASVFPVASKRIVLGTYAFMFPGKELERRAARADPATHEWTCLLRAAENPNEDISSYIKKVVFTLHPSFPQPQRTVETCPFEIHEVGWGEFEISCRIHFIDPEEKPVDIKHYLKLYPDNTQDIRTIKPPEKPREKCISTETYDEILFRSPTDKMMHALLLSQTPPSLPLHPLNTFFKSKAPSDELATYISMTNLLQNCLITEGDRLKSELIKLSSEIEVLATIHYILHPERALQVIVNNPQLMECLVDDNKDNRSAESLASVKTALLNLLAQCGGELNPSNSAPLNITKDRMNEIMSMFNKLLSNGYLSNIGFSLEGKKNQPPRPP